MQRYINIIWMICLTSAIAGCQSPKTEQVDPLEIETLEPLELSGQLHQSYKSGNASLVPTIFSPHRPRVRMASFRMDILNDGDGRTFSHVFMTYDGKVKFDGKYISIEDWFWRILPESDED